MEKNYQVVFTAPKEVELREVDMPVLKPDQMLIKTEVTQISTGTELTMLEHEVDADSAWATERSNYPIFPGYSNISTVVEVGSEVDPSWVGKRLLSGAPHKKYAIRPVNNPFFVNTIVPDGVDPEEAVFAPIAQITLGSVRAAEILPGDAVLVYGAGLIGQFVARFAKVSGAVKVFVADLSEYRLGLLPDDPCFIKVNPAEVNMPEFIKEHNNGELARVVFETTGNQKVLPSELYCVEKRGKFIITSSPRGKSSVDFDYVSTQGITIIGAHNHAIHTPTATPADPWTRTRELTYFLEMLEKKQMSVKNLISHKANYKDAPDMYNMLMADRSGAMAVHLYWEDEK